MSARESESEREKERERAGTAGSIELACVSLW